MRSFVVSSTRAVAAEHGAAPQAALEEVDSGRASPLYGVRRKEKSSRRVPPLHAKRSSESSAWPNARRAEARPRLDRERDPERAEGGLDRGARALERGQTTAISSGAVPSRTRSRTASATSSSVARRPAPSRKRIEPSSGPAGAVVEQVALEPGEPGRQIGVGAGGELDEVAARERREVGRRARERGEGRAAGLVGSETCTSPRAASASSSRHSAPVRSSKPYANTGAPFHAPSRR